MPVGFSISPPVSMSTQGTGPTRPNPYWRSRVSPGTSATMASRVPVSTLNSVDLPTLGRPTRAMTGNMARGAGRLLALFGCRRRRLGNGLLAGRRRMQRRGAESAQLAAVIDDQHQVAGDQWL